MNKSEQILKKITKLLEAKSVSVGDLVFFFGKKTEYKVTKILDGSKGLVFDAVRSDGKGGRGSELTNVSSSDVFIKGEKSTPVNQNGQTAQQAAKKLLKKAVVVNLNGAVNQTFGFVKSVSSKGILTVDHFVRAIEADPQKKFDQETFKANLHGKADETIKFVPHLFGGEWVWENKSNRLFIKGLLGKNGKLMQLLD